MKKKAKTSKADRDIETSLRTAGTPSSEEGRILRLEFAKHAPQMPGTWDYLNGRDTRTPDDLVRAHADWAMKWADAMIAAAGQPSQAEADAVVLASWIERSFDFSEESPSSQISVLTKKYAKPVIVATVRVDPVPAAVPTAGRGVGCSDPGVLWRRDSFRFQQP